MEAGGDGYDEALNINLELPAEVVEALGPEPEHEVLEGILLLLVSEGKMSVARAGETLGLEVGSRRYAGTRATGCPTPTFPKKISPTTSGTLLLRRYPIFSS